MKKRMGILLALAAAGVLLLTACTSSEQGTSQSSGVQNTGTGTQSGSGTQTVEGVQTADGEVSGVSGGNGGSQSSDSASGSQSGTASGASNAVQSVDGTVQEFTESSDGEPDGEVIPDADAQNAENDPTDPMEESESESEASEDEWSGTYIGDEETVTITQIDEETISFEFEQSGISGTAAVKGYQAVYNGDDHYVVVFNLEDDMVDVSVSNEEDYDATGSPLIGNYVKEQ